MIKTFCDKCGEEIETYSIFTIDINAPKVRSIVDDYICEKDYHLCRDCINSVVDFIEAKRIEQ